jgi:hypothetical protein
MKQGTKAVNRFRRTALGRLRQLYVDRSTPDAILDSILEDKPRGGSSTNSIPVQRTATPVEQYWSTWFGHFVELLISFETLKDSRYYFTMEGQSLGRDRARRNELTWMQYHLNVYLQEEYILYNRLLNFIRQVEKLAVRASDREGITKAKELRSQIDGMFRRVNNVRGSHVHTSRWRDSDLKGIESADIHLATMKEIGFPPSLIPRLDRLTDQRLRAFRKKWSSSLDKNTKALTEYVEEIFGYIGKFIEAHEPTK